MKQLLLGVFNIYGIMSYTIVTGKILAIIVPGPSKVFGFFGREDEYIIPYECICKIGPDVILVNVCEEKVLFKIS